MTENQISKIIFDLGLKIHKTLGPGLLESTYEKCLYYELTKKGLNTGYQIPLPLIYREIEIKTGYRLDLIVENKVIVEIKAVEYITNLHLAQILTYLRLSDCKLGLLINFNTTLFKNGVRRVINGTL